MPSRSLLQRARYQRRVASAMVERHALIRRTDTGARMLRALGTFGEPALLHYLQPADVQIAPIDAELAPALPAVSADAPFFEPSLSATSQQATAPPFAPPSEVLSEKAALPIRLPEALEQTARAATAVQSFAEVPPLVAPIVAPPVTPAPFAPPADAPTSTAVPSEPSATDPPAPGVFAAPVVPPAQPDAESTRASAPPLAAPRPRRLARAVQEGAAPGERPAVPDAAPPVLADASVTPESAALPQNDAPRNAAPTTPTERSEPASAQTPSAARTPQEIAKLLFGERDVPAARPAALHDAEHAADAEQPLPMRRSSAVEPSADAPPSATERRRAFQSEGASARSSNAPVSALFQPQAQPRTPQEWARMLAEATNPQRRSQESGVRSQESGVSEAAERQTTTDDRRPTTHRAAAALPATARRFVRPLVITPAEASEHITVPTISLPLASETVPAQQHVSTAVLAYTPDAENTPAARANDLVSPVATLLAGATPAANPATELDALVALTGAPASRFDSAVSPGAASSAQSAPTFSPADELGSPTTAERTPQEWARLLAQATNPQRRSQEPGARSQGSGVRGQGSGASKHAHSRPTHNFPTPSAHSAYSAFSEQEPAGRDYGARSDSQSSALSPQSSAVTPLRETTRRFLRPLVGIDPNSVRVHRGPLADQVAAAHAADALTLGDDVLLAAGHDEESPETIGLLAHELTHVARARTSRFVPPLLRDAPQASSDEEPLARAAEFRATEAARREQQSAPFSRATDGEAADTPQPRARTPAEQTRWGELPAPWEPLPGWLAPTTDDRRAATNDRRSATNEGMAAPPSAGPANAATPAMRAEQGRSLDGEQPAAPAAPPLAPPEADLDALARQVYDVLKQRLAAERRRLG